jgi:hypothetical protein
MDILLSAGRYAVRDLGTIRLLIIPIAMDNPTEKGQAGGKDRRILRHHAPVCLA